MLEPLRECSDQLFGPAELHWTGDQFESKGEMVKKPDRDGERTGPPECVTFLGVRKTNPTCLKVCGSESQTAPSPCPCKLCHDPRL